MSEDTQPATTNRSEQADIDRKRSPTYPSISLDKAVERAAALFKQDKGAPSSIDVIAQHWEFSAKSSGFLQTIGSLRRYGLLVELPGAEGSPRRLKLSKDAIDIVMLPSSDVKHIAAIHRAALAPPIFRELWNTHKTDLPSDSNLAHTLVTDKHFRPDAAKDLIKQYKKTIEFARLKDEDSDNGTGGNAAIGQEKPSGTMFDQAFASLMRGDSARASVQGKSKQEVQASVKQEIFSTDTGAVVVQWPASITAADYADITGWLEILRGKLLRCVPEAERAELQKADAQKRK